MRWLLVLALFFVFIHACGDDDEAAPFTTPVDTTTPSTTPASSPRPTLISEPTPEPTSEISLTYAGVTNFPSDMAIIVHTGVCYGCDAPPKGLVRVHTNPKGELVSEVLTTPARLGIDADIAGGLLLRGIASTQNASVMAVGVCVKEPCGSGALEGFSAGSETAVLRSLDGGVTWVDLGRIGPAGHVLAVFADGRVLVSITATEVGQSEFSTLPDRGRIDPPAGAYWPVAVGNELLWHTEDGARLLWSDGSRFLTVPATPGTSVSIWTVLGEMRAANDGSFLIVWDEFTPSGDPGANSSTRIGLFQAYGSESVLTRLLSNDRYTQISWWSSKDAVAMGNIAHDDSVGTRAPLPSVLDLDSGGFKDIPDAFTSPDYADPNPVDFVEAVQTGPFAQVVSTGSCLRIRAAPSLTGESLDCAADGVLLRDTGETRAVEGVTWLRVFTPGGIQGWAATGFLER